MKREERLQGLSSDHHHSLVLARKIRETIMNGETTQDICADLASHYQSELEEHFSVEEELLLPELSESCRHLATRTIDEHRLLRSYIAAAIGGDLQGLRALADTLEAHVRFEERDLYPVCEIDVPSAVLDEVAFRVPKR
jgi:hemerythrin-like domain-containing protein